MSLEGEIVLVTGATRGIGQAIALTLGQAGATVIGTATSDNGAQSISAALEGAGIKKKRVVFGFESQLSGPDRQTDQ